MDSTALTSEVDMASERDLGLELSSQMLLSKLDDLLAECEPLDHLEYLGYGQEYATQWNEDKKVGCHRNYTN